MTRKLWGIVALLLVATVAWAPSGAAAYLENVYTLSPGFGNSTPGYNQRQYNWIAFDNPHGGLPQMGSTYIYTSGVSYSWRWSNTGDLFDDRTISYGKAGCAANSGNNYSVDLWWCETNGSDG